MLTALLIVTMVPLNPVTGIQQRPDGALIELRKEFLRLEVCSDSIVRVVYSLRREIRDDSSITFADSTGKTLAEESSRTLTAVEMKAKRLCTPTVSSACEILRKLSMVWASKCGKLSR